MSPSYRNIRAQLSDSLLMIPAVAAVIRNEVDELLLQKKSDGSWSLPAGAIELHYFSQAEFPGLALPYPTEVLYGDSGGFSCHS
jgi:hypothetical protein